MTSITISLVVIESIIIMLLSYIVDFLLICIISLSYLTLYADPQLKIAIFWPSKTIVLCGALRINRVHDVSLHNHWYSNCQHESPT